MQLFLNIVSLERMINKQNKFQKYQAALSVFLFLAFQLFHKHIHI